MKNQTLENIKLFMLDMDGTVFLEDQLLPGVHQFLESCKAKGIKVVYLTNNSSKDRKSYVNKLKSLGLNVSIHDIFTSGEATIRYVLQDKPFANVFLLGNNLLEEEFVESGINLIRERNKQVDFVVLGFDTTLTYEKIWIACDYIREGIPFIATHPDLNCPLKNDNYMPDTGSMIKMFEASTNVSPIIIGKPNVQLVEILSQNLNIDKHLICMVGDRLYTDIKMAVDANITSVLVLSGETKEEDLQLSSIKPTFIAKNLGELIKFI